MNELMYVRTKVYPSEGAAVTTNLVDFAGSTGVCAVMTFPTPIEVLRMGIVVDTAEVLDVGAGFIIKLWKYVTTGVNTNAVALGTITRTADVAAGGVVYNNLGATLDLDGSVAVDGSTVFTTATPTRAQRTVLPGQQLVWDVTDVADTTGKGYVWVQYIERPFNGADIAQLLAASATVYAVIEVTA